MKIKDIRQFRKLIKTDIAELDLPSRNENYIGVSHEVREGEFEYGFFSMYHGLKSGYEDNDGVRGFLQGFLDMAKDGQAVYEFMQNAVDAWSTKFCLFWGKDEEDGQRYLLVANNGKMFNADAVQSILNIGVSTKAADNYTIGKFGIGFKLAHRLVGKENGLDELLNENYGPILFSWGNNEHLQLASMTPEAEVAPTHQQYKVFIDKGKRKAVVNTPEPWLFKILITNFPCQPENKVVPEIIKDYRYQENISPFSKSELAVMSRWLNKYRSYLENDFEHGSLFFIKLGQGKQSSLEEVNLEEGVRFSMTILNRTAQITLGHNGLSQVNLNESSLLPVNLEFENFTYARESEGYRFIRFGQEGELSDDEKEKGKNDSDIEILMGFTEIENAKETFKNAPNFYLFFPLSEEKHRLCFILHSNAFYKSSSRTYLQKGNIGDAGINERLFSTFAKDLTVRLKNWATSSEKLLRERFLTIYATLLLSNESDNPERVWINEPLWQPLFEFLRTNIPVRSFDDHLYRLETDSKNVRLKETALPVDIENWLGSAISWFYWDKTTNSELSAEAGTKLEITSVTILEILKHPNVSSAVNTWLAKDAQKVAFILNELENDVHLLIEGKDPKADLFKNNVANLELWQFSNDIYHSIVSAEKDAETNRYLILNVRIDDLNPYLIRAGFYTSKVTLSNYQNLYKYLQTSARLIKTFNDYDFLLRTINDRFATANFEAKEKKDIFAQILKIGYRDNDERINRYKTVRLFTNANHEVQPLGQLLKATDLDWLSSWCINPDEYFSDLNDYLTAENAIYDQVIQPFWDTIIEQPKLNDEKYPAIFENVAALYKETPRSLTLSDKKIIQLSGNWCSNQTEHFYSPSLKTLPPNQYLALSEIHEKLGIPALPNSSLLSFYEEAPFKLEKTILAASPSEAFICNIEAIKGLLTLCKTDDREIFDELHIGLVENDLTIIPAEEDAYQISTSQPSVIRHLEQFDSAAYYNLPDVFNPYRELVALKDDDLILQISDDCNLDNIEQLVSLLKITALASSDTKQGIIKIIPPQIIDLDQRIEAASPAVLLISLIINTFQSSDATIKAIKEKLIVKYESEEYKWSEVELAGNDTVTIMIGEEIFTLSLAEIMPENSSITTKIAGILSTKLNSIGIADKTVLDHALGLGLQMSKTHIAKYLSDNYKETPLKTADQIAFLILSRLTKYPEIQLAEFTVNTQSGILPLSDAVFYFPETAPEFIHRQLVLDSQYANLRTKLRLPQKIATKYTDGIIFVDVPYFLGNVFHMPGVAEINKEHQHSVVEYLYYAYSRSSEIPKIILPGDEIDWASVLGFDPEETIQDTEWAFDHEQLPQETINWLIEGDEKTNSQKTDFLKALGVSFSRSSIVQIRRFLAGDRMEQPEKSYRYPISSWVNTLKFICNRQVSFHQKDPRKNLLLSLFNDLETLSNIIDIPMLVFDADRPGNFTLSVGETYFYLTNDELRDLNETGYNIFSITEHITSAITYAEYFPAQWLKIENSPFKKLPLSLGDFDVHADKVEWSRTYYEEWKKSYPGINIYGFEHALPRQLKINGQPVYSYCQGNIEVVENELIINSSLGDKLILQLIEETSHLPGAALLLLKRLREQYESNIQDYIQKIQTNPKYRDEWEKIKRRLQEEAKRKQLSQDFGSAQPYSIDWFLKLLELLITNADGGTNSSTGYLSFKGIETNGADHRIIALTNPVSTVYQSIEYFNDYAAEFTFTDLSGTIKTKHLAIKSVIRSGQRVIIQPESLLEVEELVVGKVIRVDLSYRRPSGLLTALRSKFERLELPTEFNVKTELTENVQFIFGPPGTGKTTTIAGQILDRMRNDPDHNILVLTPTNKAANVIVKRLMKECKADDNAAGWLVRYGNAPDEEIIDADLARDAGDFNFYPSLGNVIVTTIHRFFFDAFKVDRGAWNETTIALDEVDWDTIIFDEASMIMLPAVIYPMLKRKMRVAEPLKETEFIIGGDPLQIPPIYNISEDDLPDGQKEVKEENIYTMIGLTSFQDSAQAMIPKYAGKIKNLYLQYRSVAPIGKLFSRFSYDDQLKHARELGLNSKKTKRSRELPDFFNELGFKPITVIRYKVNYDAVIYTSKKLDGSPFQLYSAFLTNELIKRFKSESKQQPWSLGVITPYRAQADLLTNMIESQTFKNPAVSVNIDTVHGFQGDESEVVFALFNPSEFGSNYSSLFKKKFIINVAISRAEDYLILMLPEDLSGATLLAEGSHNSLLSLLKELEHREDIAYINADAIEERLMGSRRYFEDHVESGNHQDINIYGTPGDKYMVRLNKETLDIHWSNS